MDITYLILAYVAMALVALAVTAAFSSSIDRMLYRLLPEEIAPHWARFIKFAVFVVSCGGGMPLRMPGAFVDRDNTQVWNAGDGIMLIMGSASGALMSAAWILMVFFGATLAATIAIRALAVHRQAQEKEARESAQRLEEYKAENERSEPRAEPLRRMEPAEPRPVSQEKTAQKPSIRP